MDFLRVDYRNRQMGYGGLPVVKIVIYIAIN